MNTEDLRNKPRFIFVSNQQAVTSWHEPPLAMAGAFTWRMIAGNNRPIASSACAFSTLTDCTASVERLCTGVEDLDQSILFDELDGRWWWSAQLEGVEIARCAVPAKRRIEALRAVTQFLDVLRNDPSRPPVVRYLGVYSRGRAPACQARLG